MGVEVYGVIGETNGYGDSMDAFRDAHDYNSRILINLAMGRKKNDPTPPYDPRNPANAWPKMVYHATYGERIVNNETDLEQAKLEGYRRESYPKPQIAVLDPALEKAAMLAKNRELEGKLVAANDLMSRMEERLKALEKRDRKQS